MRVLLQHEGKIFTAHKRLHLAHLLCAKQRCRHLPHHRVGRRIVTQYRAAVDVRQRGRGVEALRLSHGDIMDPLQHGLAHLLIEGAHRELHQHVIVNDIGRVSGLDAADGDHRRFERGDIPRDDRLQREGDMAGDQRGIHGMLRYRAVAANAFHLNMQRIGGGHHRPVAQADLAQRLTRHIVQAEDGIAGEPVKQTVLDHHSPAVQQLFRGLENQLQRPGKLAGARQIFSRVEQRGGVPVMAAAVETPVNLACPRLPAPLLHRQGIHIRPQAEAFFSVADAQRAHHSGARQAAVNLVSPLAKQSSDLIAGLMFFKADLRLLVELATQGNKLRLVDLQGFKQRMCHFCYSCVVFARHFRVYAGETAFRCAFLFYIDEKSMTVFHTYQL